MTALEHLSGCQIVYVLLDSKPNVRKLIQIAYAHDYAPVKHLNSKVRYLRRKSLFRKSVTHVFFTMRDPAFDLRGDGAFRHIHSPKLTHFKDMIRQRYNPIIGGVTSHQHVVHISDNPEQSLHAARCLGLEVDGAQQNPFSLRRLGLDLPIHLASVSAITIQTRKISDLTARVRVSEGETLSVSVDQTPHYQAIAKGDFESYEQYVGNSMGQMFRDGHNSTKFQALLAEIEKSGRIDAIVVKGEENNERLEILDGLHRASIALHLKIDKVQVAIVGSTNE